MEKKFKKIIIGGSFDLLHVGHKALILEAFRRGEQVAIGVTSDRFNKDREKQTWESQATRVKSLEGFLRQRNLDNRAKIVLIKDIFGTALKDPKLEAIIVTKETIANANIVNRERIKKGFKELEVIVLPHAKDSQGKIISSSRIRDGQINRFGQSYLELLFKIADKPIPQDILQKFKQPLGRVVKKIGHSKNQVITVGDVSTLLILEKNITPKLSIIDLKTHRKSFANDLDNELFKWIPTFNKILKVDNPQSTISRELILRVEKVFKTKAEKQLIIVEGEEDLAAIPAILFSPLGAKVYYGQPDEGVVEVIVDQEIKETVLKYLSL